MQPVCGSFFVRSSCLFQGQVKQRYNDIGDVGLVAAKMAKTTRTLFGGHKPREPLSAPHVLGSYLRIAQLSGKHS